MFRRLIKIAGIVLFALFIVATLAFTSLEFRNATCRNIEINYEKDEVIRVDKDDLVNLVKKADDKILGKKLEEVDARQIEKAVEQHEAVLSAEVYKVVTKSDSSKYTGVLAVKVKHREPVVRIMSTSGNYYLDRLGGKIPVSTNYTANVLVVTGSLSEDFAREKLLPCILYIENDEFWNAQIQQVDVAKNGDIVFIPLVGEHIVEFGKVDNYREKLRNMKAFYKQVLANDNWNKYKSISVKYKNQVIAKRK